MSHRERLLLASQNEGKLAEMRLLVAGLAFEVVGPGEVGLTRAPEETGATFQENAALKARYYARASGLLTVADDSGLSVDALDGAPGLFTARFAGVGASDTDRNALLLARLRGVPRARRGARFSCAVAVAREERLLFQTLATVDGEIAEAPSGPNGFGYDPVFFYQPFGATFAEMPPADKDRVSHRGQAFARVRAFLVERAGARL